MFQLKQLGGGNSKIYGMAFSPLQIGKDPILTDAHICFRNGLVKNRQLVTSKTFFSDKIIGKYVHKDLKNSGKNFQLLPSFEQKIAGLCNERTPKFEEKQIARLTSKHRN